MGRKLDSSNEEFSTALDKIKQDFVLRLEKQVSDFEEFSRKLADKKIENELVQDVRMKSHKIAGSAAMFGFESLGDVAAEVEHAIIPE